jgi:hypothetical protein
MKPTKPLLLLIFYFLIFLEIMVLGIVFSIMLFILSLFRDGREAKYIRYFSLILLIPFFVCGLIQALVYFILDYINYRKSAKKK